MRVQVVINTLITLTCVFFTASVFSACGTLEADVRDYTDAWRLFWAASACLVLAVFLHSGDYY